MNKETRGETAMKQLTIEEMQTMIKEFCDERDWEQYHNPKDLAIGISTEANELLDLFRFKNEQQAREVIVNKSEEVADELVDVMYFVLRFAQLNDIDLSAQFIRKMAKNSEKYPKDKVVGNNLKYNEYNIK